MSSNSLSPVQYIETYDFSERSFAEINQIRRKLLTEIETLAISAVEIIVNTSVISDDIVVHRLYLVLINSKNLDPAACICQELECPACTLLYELNVTNTTDSVLDVYSNELKPYNSNEPSRVVPDIILLRLLPGQKIYLFAYIQRGTGAKHAAWSHYHAYHNPEKQLIVEHYGTVDPSKDLQNI